MNNQDFLKTQSCVLRVNIHCDGCKDKVKKILRKIDGVYTIKIEAEQGKVTVTGNIDPSVLIKKLEKSGKHAHLWGPPPKATSNQNNGNNQQQFMSLNHQFKNMNFDGGKIGKDNITNHNGGSGMKGQKGGKDQQNVKGGGQQQQQLPPQQNLQQQQQMLQFLQQQMGGAKDFKMPPPPIKSNDQKSVKFNLPNDDFDDGFDDDEYDDDDEFDDDDYDDDEFDDDMYGGHLPPTKINVPIMGNVHALGGKGGGDMKGMHGGGKSEDKGKDGKKDGKNGGGGGKDKGQNGNFHPNQGGAKNNGGGGGGGGNGNQKGGPKPNNGGLNGNNSGNPNGGQKGGGGGGFGFNDFNHGKNNGPNMGMMGQMGMGNYAMGQNMMQMQPRATAGLPAGPPQMNGGHNGNNPLINVNANGGKKGGGGGLGGNNFDGKPTNGPNMGPVGMGNYSMAPMGPMGQSMIQPPAAAGLPAGPPPHMMNGGGGGGGFYQGSGPMGPYNNPQQQQYMAMMMNQQRMNGGDHPYGGMYPPPQAMMYGRPQMGVGYGPSMVPPPTYHDPYTSYFSDENTTNTCSIM